MTSALPDSVQARLADPTRLAAVARLGLIGTPHEEAFDRLTRLATRLLGTPGALVNLITDEGQFCKSSLGLPEPWASEGLPLTYGLCPYTVASGEPLLVTDARCDPRFQENPGVRELGVVGYAGVPLLTSDGQAVGAFCAFDDHPHAWTAEDHATLQDLAAAAMVELELRAAAVALRERARQAELNAAVGTALARPRTLTDQLQQCTEAIVQHLDATFARIWTLNVTENVLELQASAGRYTHRDGTHSRVPVGELKIGRIAAERQPHLTNDVAHDPAISDPAWAVREGMVAFAGYPLIVEERLVGVLALFAAHPLPDDTMAMLATVADVVATGIERKRAEAALRAEGEILEAINQVGRLLTAELDLAALVQAVTDAATSLTGAHFGAFFYNALDDRGEYYTLYAIAGVPREAFEQFPLPRNTALFGPTFRGEGTVRIADVRADARFGKNPPHYGMPAGHLPVVSYLAVPVIGRAEEVLGGLFFGHPEVGVFDARAERLAEGLAAQAAVAVENARLYQQAQQELVARRQAEAEKEAFLEAVAHDLANPLAALKGQAQLLQRRAKQGRADPATLHAGLSAIDVATDRATRLLGELTDAARLAAEQPLALSHAPTDLVALVKGLATEFQAAAAGHQLQVETRLSELVGPWDADRLARVLENLLTNAIKYSPSARPVVVHIDREDEPDGPQAVLSVVDRGVGIPAADLPHIFERFHRGGNVSGRIAGTGLGLWGSQRIVAQHGGTISIVSVEGEGTTVTVRLPLVVNPEPVDLASVPSSKTELTSATQ
jgi:signal transduction histidine kinase